MFAKNHIGAVFLWAELEYFTCYLVLYNDLSDGTSIALKTTERSTSCVKIDGNWSGSHKEMVALGWKFV